MKALIQRVTQAKVTVGEEMVSSIGKGICVLVGISRKDTVKDAEYLVRKILNLRVFEDDTGRRWDKNVMDKQYEILCVSQFTLNMILKGNKPDFHDAMGPELSQQFYENFLQQLKDGYAEDKIKDGRFGAMMQVHIQNDGPVTIPLESPANLPDKKPDKRQVKSTNKGNNKSQTEGATSNDTGAASAGDS